jgi:uncharacterized Tic20 family protein
LSFQDGIVEPTEPLVAMEMVVNDLPGNSYTMHSAASSNLVDIPDRITDAVMIEINLVLQMCSMVIAGVMNSLKEIISQKSSELIGIDLVILISFRSYQFVATRLRDN